jgi:hypothetical protein
VQIKKFALTFMAVIVAFVLVATFSVFRVGYQHQQAAEQFWGDDYSPEDEDAVKVDWGFVGNIVIPKGGPLIASDVTGLCTETPLPMVPIKVSADGTSRVLCGIGSKAKPVEFDVANIPDRNVRDVVAEALRAAQQEKRR